MFKNFQLPSDVTNIFKIVGSTSLDLLEMLGAIVEGELFRAVVKEKGEQSTTENPTFVGPNDVVVSHREEHRGVRKRCRELHYHIWDQ